MVLKIQAMFIDWRDVEKPCDSTMRIWSLSNARVQPLWGMESRESLIMVVGFNFDPLILNFSRREKGPK